MSDHDFAETRLIGFWNVFVLLLLGPIIALVYALYAFGYWLGETKLGFLVYPYSIAFAVVNTAHNWTVCTVLFREWPREFFTTTRLKRHKTSPDPWRREQADMLGGFLNSQDGGHY
jgi:hypothetical protein